MPTAYYKCISFGFTKRAPLLFTVRDGSRLDSAMNRGECPRCDSGKETLGVVFNSSEEPMWAVCEDCGMRYPLIRQKAPAHRPRRDPMAARVPRSYRVHPTTAAAINAEARRSGESEGQVIDRLASTL